MQILIKRVLYFMQIYRTSLQKIELLQDSLGEEGRGSTTRPPFLMKLPYLFAENRAFAEFER